MVYVEVPISDEVYERAYEGAKSAGVELEQFLATWLTGLAAVTPPEVVPPAASAAVPSE